MDEILSGRRDSEGEFCRICCHLRVQQNGDGHAVRAGQGLLEVLYVTVNMIQLIWDFFFSSQGHEYNCPRRYYFHLETQEESSEQGCPEGCPNEDRKKDFPIKAERIQIQLLVL